LFHIGVSKSFQINSLVLKEVNMKPRHKSLGVVVAIVIFSAISFSQDFSLTGRSALELNFGFWGGAKASNSLTIHGIQSEANTNGFSGTLLYSHWIQEQLSVTLSAGFLAGEASSTISPMTVNQRASAIVPILLGVKYYFLSPAQDDAVRPFVSTALGVYIGSEASNTIVTQNAHTETVYGGQFGLGLDFLLSNHFKMCVSARYNMMSDFSTPVGARSNYNGAEASIGIGYIF
jgi:outer membrane protein W